MGIILTTTGLPLLTSAKGIASQPVRAVQPPLPPERPEPDPDVGSPIDPGPAVSEFTYRGVTVKLSTPLPVYYSANGDPVIIAETASSITSISPASAQSGGYWINGAERNPSDSDGGTAQGYDEALGTGSPTGKYPYSAGRNVDPGATGQAIAIGQGSAFTVKKAVRDPAAAAPNSWTLVQKYVVITVMPSPPPFAGSWFRPPVGTRTKSWQHRADDLVLAGPSSPLRHLGQPSGLGKASAYLADIRAKHLHTLPIELNPSERGRRMQLTGDAGSSGYSRDTGRERGRYACSLFIDPGASQSEIDARRELAIILTQWGIDRDGAHQMGARGSNGAGQWYGFIEFLYLAAFLLRDAAMLARAQAHASCSIGQIYWVTEGLVGFPCNWDTGSEGGGTKRVGETLAAEMVGKPEWTIQGWQNNDNDATMLVGNLPALNANLYGAYRDANFTTHIVEMFPICLLRNGPNGETGIEAVNRGQPPQPGSVLSTAALPYIDRSMTFEPLNYGGVGGHDGASRNIYNLWRDEIPQARWKGAPDITASHDYPNFAAGGSAGQVKWSLAGYTYATEPVLERQISYSQDGVQFSAPLSVGTATSYTITGLRPGTKYWCRWRQRSASGWSQWSHSWEQCLESGDAPALYKTDRGTVTTPGTASGALTNATAPMLVRKPYVAHEMPYFEADPLTNVANVTTFYAGMGTWTGGTGALSASYQWQRNTGGGWANIAGATAQTYNRQAADSGAQVRCGVSVNGSPTIHTNAVSVPSPRVYAAATVIDTTLDGEFPFDWPIIWNEIQTSPQNKNMALELLPYAQPSQAMTPGILRIKKNGPGPTLDAALTTAAQTGTYRWEVEFGAGFFPNYNGEPSSGDAIFQLRNGAGAVRGDASVTIPKEDFAEIGVARSGSGTFTVSGGDTTIRLYVKVDYNAGAGQNGVRGGAILAKLKVWRS